jgi:hypothetical protein
MEIQNQKYDMVVKTHTTKRHVDKDPVYTVTFESQLTEGMKLKFTMKSDVPTIFEQFPRGNVYTLSLKTEQTTLTQ